MVNNNYGNLDFVEDLLDELIQIPSKNNLKIKLDYLENLIGILRWKNKHLQSDLSFEDAIASERFIDNGKIAVKLITGPYSSGTPSMELQSKLLLYLAICHNRNYEIIDIIDNFILTIWDSLDMVDFKKTKTGVYRCHTNTRFAANTLRSYGFLKFTKREAFKTWKLSISGFFAASYILEKYSEQWADYDCSKPYRDRKYKGSIYGDILDAQSDMQDYSRFIKRLEYICRPNSDIFTTFSEVLNEAYSLLIKYWRVLSNPSTKNKEEASYKIIQEIDNLPCMEIFYNELSMSLNLDRLLKDLRLKK